MNAADSKTDKAVMLNREWPEKQRVWACLKLHTMGFTRAVAVTVKRGQAVPLRQVDIAKETGIDRRSVYRCVAELEREGWLLREAAAAGPDGMEYQIHCYPVPRKPKGQTTNGAGVDSRLQYAGLPLALAGWLKRLKLPVPPVERLQVLEEQAVALNQAVEQLRASCRA